MNHIIVIGGGPMGLNSALSANRAGMRVTLLESESFLGGQLTHLYPEKEITDIPGYEPLPAASYIARLIDAVKASGMTTLLLNTKAQRIITHTDYVEVTADEKVFSADAVIIAIGLGTFVPRTMDLPGEKGADNIIYKLISLASFKDKAVVILGGGDSAIDWANMATRVTDRVVLIHRRKDFRGNFATIENNPKITIKTPFIPLCLHLKGNHLERIEIQNTQTGERENLPLDLLMVNFGQVPVAESFGFDKTNFGLKVGADLRLAPRVFALGDAASYEGKVRRIAPALAEIEKVIGALKD